MSRRHERRAHWERVYGSRAPTELSWYAPHLALSFELIRAVSSEDSSVLDVGGGASTLADDLLDAGYRRVAVLDISEAALAAARARLGARASAVTWLQADITSDALPADAYDVWHDRAVFHFLTEATERARYVAALKRSLKATGHVVIGTFSLRGPEKCSGLPVARYDAAGLGRELGPEFSLSRSEELVHATPGGNEQAFVFCQFARRA